MYSEEEFIGAYTKLGATEEEARKVYQILTGPTEEFLFALALWALEFSVQQSNPADS
jgi:hypothetical protein